MLDPCPYPLPQNVPFEFKLTHETGYLVHQRNHGAESR
jgi:hypothetical protein